jgi:hypothetical protein
MHSNLDIQRYNYLKKKVAGTVNDLERSNTAAITTLWKCTK